MFAPIIDALSGTTTIAFDGAGRQTSLTDPVGNQTRWSYDQPHRLTTIVWGSTDPSIAYNYDGASRITTITRLVASGGGVVTSYVYDAANRLTTQVSKTPGGSVLATIVYGYDAANRLMSEQDKERRATFSYDPTSQLTTVTGARSESYGHDSNGNRNTAGYSTGPANEVTASSGHTYVYDNEGNLTSKTNTSSYVITTYTYDHRNRLIGVKEGGTVLATYTYDALDRRIGFKLSGTQTWTVYDGNTATDHPYADFNGSGTLLNRYVWGPGVGVAVDQVLARIDAGGTKSWYLTDRLGTVRDITSGTGTILDHVIYDSYGQVDTG